MPEEKTQAASQEKTAGTKHSNNIYDNCYSIQTVEENMSTC